ncbi:hypothetical protein [Paenarthrobacter sp. A20]|uniref:hypothetical protein n=1 Tax=Paenarthrobacter sp. A20 TaxID=2817891 RepID=UPI00209EA7B2|nr:hypothetical protein [Paenarthrobacter sp. A20]MCP1413681.1 hypothetical protein [Paenarthrobacter sp. A20]
MPVPTPSLSTDPIATAITDIAQSSPPHSPVPTTIVTGTSTPTVGGSEKPIDFTLFGWAS